MDDSLLTLENARAAYESLNPENPERNDTKATALRNQVSQLRMALHDKDVMHDVSSKEIWIRSTALKTV